MVNNLVMRPPSLSGVVSPMKAKATSFLNTLCHAHSEREREREKSEEGVGLSDTILRVSVLQLQL
jgi:hypothetical protein